MTDLADPRLYCNITPKNNLLIKNAVLRDEDNLYKSIIRSLELGQDKLISIAINLAPSYEVVHTIENIITKIFLDPSNKIRLFAIPVLVISSKKDGDSVNFQLSKLQINNLVNLISQDRYQVELLTTALIDNISQIPISKLYHYQITGCIDNIELNRYLSSNGSQLFHNTENSNIAMKYLVGSICGKNDESDIFSNVFTKSGMDIMQILQSLSNGYNDIVYIPCTITHLINAVNKSRFYFAESVFNIEISDSIKSVRMDNDGILSAKLSTSASNKGNDLIHNSFSYIVLRLYKYSLNSVKVNNVPQLQKELTWPLAALDDFSVIVRRISQLLTSMGVKLI